MNRTARSAPEPDPFVRFGSALSEDVSGHVLSVRVVSNAKTTEIVREEDDGTKSLRIRIAAPASDNKANALLVKFVAEIFGVRRRQVSIVAGLHSRTKSVHIAHEKTVRK